MEGQSTRFSAEKEKPIRILHVITESNLGGAQRNTLLSAKGFNHAPYAVEVLAGPGGPGIPGQLIEKAGDEGIASGFLTPLVRRLSPIKDMRVLLRLYARMRKRRYLIVHTHSTKAGFLGRLAAALARVPVVIHTVHGFPFATNRTWKTGVYFLLEKIFSRMTDVIVTVARGLEEEMLRRNVAPSNKIVTLYSGIDFSRFRDFTPHNGLREELGLDSEALLVGFVGRLSKQKAPENLVAAAPRVLQQCPNAVFLLAGEGPLRGRLEEQIQRKNLEQSVLLLGERKDIPEILSQLDLFVLPSRWEGLGRALTEAMYAGLPVVASRVNGVPELVEEGITGFLVPPDDVEPLSRAILRVLEDRVSARQIGMHGRARVKGIMDVQTMVKGLERVYKRCLAEKGFLCAGA